MKFAARSLRLLLTGIIVAIANPSLVLAQPVQAPSIVPADWCSRLCQYEKCGEGKKKGELIYEGSACEKEQSIGSCVNGICALKEQTQEEKERSKVPPAPNPAEGWRPDPDAGPMATPPTPYPKEGWEPDGGVPPKPMITQSLTAPKEDPYVTGLFSPPGAEGSAYDYWVARLLQHSGQSPVVSGSDLSARKPSGGFPTGPSVGPAFRGSPSGFSRGVGRGAAGRSPAGSGPSGATGYAQPPVSGSSGAIGYAEPSVTGFSGSAGGVSSAPTWWQSFRSWFGW
jgi:hypothetical protein